MTALQRYNRPLPTLFRILFSPHVGIHEYFSRYLSINHIIYGLFQEDFGGSPRASRATRGAEAMLSFGTAMQVETPDIELGVSETLAYFSRA
jgi:hypothetical protein